MNFILEKSLFAESDYIVKDRRASIESLKQSLFLALNDRIKSEKNALGVMSAKLDALSPLSVLSRGYAILESDGKVVSDAQVLSTGDEISVKLEKSIVLATVKSVIKQEVLK